MSRRALILVAAAVGCHATGDVGSNALHDTVVKIYDREIQFDQPRACDVLLERRTTDERKHIVEYNARVGGRELSIVYAIVVDDPLPLQVSLYDASGQGLFSVEAADHALEVLGSDGTLLRSVDHYDGTSAQTAVQGTGTIGDADALTLLGCALAGRTELGDVAAFLRNLSSGGMVPGQPDVGQSSENAQPILKSWTGNVTLLGAFELMSGCLDRAGWRCGCWNGQGWCS